MSLVLRKPESRWTSSRQPINNRFPKEGRTMGKKPRIVATPNARGYGDFYTW